MYQAGKVLLGVGGGFVALGVLWVIIYFLSASAYPIGALGQWNLVIGMLIASLSFLPLLIGLILFLVGRKNRTRSVAP